ncbi:M3 family oligoendopeptidase, partial [Romboutsia sp.]|uniref:M3 family oligoendopeptidase n=1 Tax=Romboutsia sp. TaxID=1965302 RepID=UPI003F2B6E42
MQTNWSLKEIYPSFDSNEFKNDIKKLEELIKIFNSWVKESIADYRDSKEKLEEYIRKRSEIQNISSRLENFISLNLSVNTSNLEALKYSDILSNALTSVVEGNTLIEKWISNTKDIENLINQSELLIEHRFIIKKIIEENKYSLSEREENIIANMKNTGSKSWSKLKDKLVSNHRVAIMQDGEIKKLPLTVVLNMANDKDAEVRKKAYKAEIKSYKRIEESVAAALNGIKGEVITECKLRGYKSPLEKTLLDSRMSEKTLNAMLDAIKESLPVFRKYLRRKSELLGHNDGLPFYDLYAPVVDSDMTYEYEKGSEFVVKNFRTFSDDLADFAKKAIDNAWIDVYPKEGKVGGAFCSNLHVIGESRFLLNYGDSFKDVSTLAHELGHGFHGECLNNEAVLNTDYPMPIAETASIFCETIIKNAAIKEANKKETLAILESDISGCTQVIVDIYSRFLFEKEVFEKRETSALSVDEIKDAMIKAQKEAYGDGLDQNYLHPYMWLWKPHYYDANYNFYNFPYAFGELFARGLYARYLKEGSKFVKDYEKLLSITGKNNLVDVAKTVGLDIENIDFWRSSLKIIED